MLSIKHYCHTSGVMYEKKELLGVRCANSSRENSLHFSPLLPYKFLSIQYAVFSCLNEFQGRCLGCGWGVVLASAAKELRSERCIPTLSFS